MKQLLLKTVLFSVLALFCVNAADRFFLDHEQGDIASFDDFYSAKKNSVDIIFLGNSHLHRGIDPDIIEAKTELRTTMLVGGGLTIAKVYFNLLEALKYQNPKLVVLECWPVLTPNWKNNSPLTKNGRIRVNKFGSESFKKIGRVKLKEIYLTEAENKLFNSFAIFRNHEKWVELTELINSTEIYLNDQPREVFKSTQKHLLLNDFASIEKFKETSFESENIRITQDELLYFEKIIALSKKHNFDLLLFTAPIYSEYYSKTIDGFHRAEKQLDSISQGHNHIKLLDLNKKYGGFDETHILKEKELATNQHLSLKGILKTSVEVANYIKENYTFNTSNTINKNTIEYILVNHTYGHDEKFEGRVDKVNGQRFEQLQSPRIFTVDSNANNIVVEGWMKRKGVDTSNAIKQIALVNNSGFIMISGDKLKPRAIPYLVTTKGKDYSNVGYKYVIPKTALDTSLYKVYHIIQSKHKTNFVKDMHVSIQVN